MRTNTTSTSTIKDGATFWMYYVDMTNQGKITTATSTDGCTYASAQDTGIPTDHALPLSNPSVIKLASGTYVMLYEKDNTVPRLYRATSTDGVTFTPITGAAADGAVLEADGTESNWVSVPDMIEFDGKLWVYYVAARTAIARASSTDQGATWSAHERVTIVGGGMTATDRFVDPDILINSCNKLRLVFAYSTSGGNFGSGGIRSALSSDGGALFTAASPPYVEATAGSNVIDPDVVVGTAPAYFMYYGRESGGPPELRGAQHP